ncbi:RNA-directed DNA polymerase, eukaryota, Reverse transcriptase zinc-binding domain protein [Artemisia annua]|uniref:RNA-directed DNA polymerase, eukaryota, Reverse transcriptase zinc-binding domain protein n=1 Tax=Artemisia annua TaxID=35608 RepID=A0A2U1PE15_ARTAN|nr:RNA-directed DNA polymerase, eukaryota, Reverse transcriptase zinc-binding domain protein [Artemisia annua]
MVGYTTKVEDPRSSKTMDVGSTTNLNMSRCPLCEMCPDSHNHLFFNCMFSSQAWTIVKTKADMLNSPSSLNHIVDWIVPFAKKMSAHGVIAKIVFAASTYFVWQEQNGRFFKQQKRSRKQLSEVILSTVRLKLLMFNFRNSSRIDKVLNI